MNSFRIYILFCFCFSFSLCTNAQKKKKNKKVEAPTEVVQINTDSIINEPINNGEFQLPPLSVLYENARSNPSIAILEKEKQLQNKLLSKEKKSWLKYFAARANYSHGVTDNYGTSTDQLTPVFYQYTGMEQDYWTVGGSLNIPIEDLLDLKGKVKRQRIAVEKAELTKEQAFDELKQQIIHLYISIQSNLELLKSSAQHLALYRGVCANTEEEFRNRRTTIDAVAAAKKMESEANIEFQGIRSNIKEQILILEVISKTEILNDNN